MKALKTTLITICLSLIALSKAEASECIYNPKIIEIIASSLRFPDATVDAKQSVAFKSNDYKNLYFIAARVKSDAFAQSIGVWVSNGLDSGMIFSGNSDAVITTVFPDGQKSGPKVKPSDHGYNEVVACFNKKFNVK